MIIYIFFLLGSFVSTKCLAQEDVYKRQDVRWANFGSIGVSWNVQNEIFYNIPWMNILKIKASYVANGNSRLGSQEALGLYSYGESYSYAPLISTLLRGEIVYVAEGKEVKIAVEGGIVEVTGTTVW